MHVEIVRLWSLLANAPEIVIIDNMQPSVLCQSKKKRKNTEKQ